MPPGLALAIALNQLWNLVLPPWLLFPLLAGAVTITGLLYPCVSGEEAPDISEIMRCVAVFVGIFQASTVSPLTHSHTPHSLNNVGQTFKQLPSVQCIEYTFKKH